MLEKILLVIMGTALLVNIQQADAHHDNPIVMTPLGRVKGVIQKSALGKPIYSFRGIPFAKAPVNELRFKPPVPAEKWDHVYDATKDRPGCPQPEPPMAEDCLIVNVFTTELPERSKNPKRPVIVHFHPGGLTRMSSSSIWYGAEYFADRDVVLVTFNYRLGALGFLSTGDELAPGNNGFKDQVLALKWVKDNIGAFGGDPDLVTIWGYSAGAISASLHLHSPMSTGLFHRAILMSGAIYGQYPIKTNQFDLAQKQARLLGCPDDTSANIIKCLKTKSPQEFADSVEKFEEFAEDPLFLWLPVVEPDFGQERFLTEDPVKMIQCGHFSNKVPVITGVTTDEFGYSAFDIVKNPALLKEMDEDFERVAPIAFIYERNTETSTHISKELRKFYLGDGPLSNSSLSGLTKLYADGVTGFGVNRAAKMLAVKSREPVFYYRFNFQGRWSNFVLPDTNTPYGIFNLDDMMYMFYVSPLFPLFNQTDPEYATMKKLTTLLANFAHTGNPTSTETAELDDVHWDPFTIQHKRYLDIGEKLTMKENLYEDRYATWEKLFPLSECSHNEH